MTTPDRHPTETVEEALARIETAYNDRLATIEARMHRFPVGYVQEVWRPTAQPGTLLLQGQTVQRADYPDLAAWIEQADPTGLIWTLTATTIVLPDGRGRTLIGAGVRDGVTYAVGATGGAHQRTLALNQMPIHDHAVGGSGTAQSAGGHSHSGTTSTAGSHGGHRPNVNPGVGGNDGARWPTDAEAQAGAHSHSFTTGDAGGHNHSISLNISEQSRGGTTPLDLRTPYLAINYAVWV